MTTRSRAARRLDRFESAAEDVVVGDGDASEADPLGVLDELVRRDGAVVRPLRVQVEVDGDPLAVGERVVLDEASGSGAFSVSLE